LLTRCAKFHRTLSIYNDQQSSFVVVAWILALAR
jgi:hypothetical protein